MHVQGEDGRLREDQDAHESYPPDAAPLRAMTSVPPSGDGGGRRDEAAQRRPVHDTPGSPSAES